MGTGSTDEAPACRFSVLYRCMFAFFSPRAGNNVLIYHHQHCSVLVISKLQLNKPRILLYCHNTHHYKSTINSANYTDTSGGNLLSKHKAPQLTSRDRMPPGKREALKKFGRSLVPPPIRRDKSSRETSPAPSRPTSSTAPSNNPMSGHPIPVGTGTGSMASPHTTLPGPAHAAATQPLNIKPLAPVPPKNQAFENAIKVILQKHANLSDGDKQAFQSASYLDVMAELRRAQQGTSDISGSLTRVQKVLDCINRFMGPLATFIQHSPEISSLVVGGLSCILIVRIPQHTSISITTYVNKFPLEQLGIGYIGFFEKLTKMMDRIGCHLSYISEYASATFQDSDKIQEVRTGHGSCNTLPSWISS